ncbi:MAG: acyltransferase [Desulfobacterales bacterium]|nr:acyltransferase [Desulfobacterales bacterium]
MLDFLPGPLRGVLSILFCAVNTIFWATPIFIMSFFKLVIPARSSRKLCSGIADGCATCWIAVNNFNIRLFSKIRWDVEGLDHLKRRDWYMVLANHQTWTDILVLQKVFHRKIPFLKFFLKKELIWFPVLGQAWWALDFPFMRRYSSAFLKKNPHLKGKDLEVTRKACEKFKTIPVSVMNFVEGTRFTPKKHQKQGSPYNHLLRTKAGGIAFALGAMGGNIHHILDVTIIYPGGARNIWDFVCGKVSEIKVRVKTIPVTSELLGDYFQDEEFREKFQEWLNNLWAEKDARIHELLLEN